VIDDHVAAVPFSAPFLPVLNQTLTLSPPELEVWVDIEMPAMLLVVPTTQ
jgi:hypothetical protein